VILETDSLPLNEETFKLSLISVSASRVEGTVLSYESQSKYTDSIANWNGTKLRRGINRFGIHIRWTRWLKV
jgi:hypothetical protein